MADIFLSYAKETKAQAKVIADALTAEGYDVWWDAELPPHKAYSDVIEEEIGLAKAVLVAWSDAADQSHWVRAEADMARIAGKLVQTAIQVGFIPPMPFSQIQVADLSSWRGEGNHTEWEKVRAAVSELVRGAPAGEAPNLNKRRNPLDTPRRSLVAWLVILIVSLAGIGALTAGGSHFYLQSIASKVEAETKDHEQKLADEQMLADLKQKREAQNKERVEAAGWAIDRAAQASVTLRPDDKYRTASCNAAWITKNHVVTLASCLIVRDKRKWFADGEGAWPIGAELEAPQRHGNLIVMHTAGLFGPLGEVRVSKTSPAVDELVYPGVMARPEGDFINAPGCKIAAPDAAGVRISDCVNPGGRLGTPLFNKAGELVGLMNLDSSVVPVEQIRAGAIALGVAVK